MSRLHQLAWGTLAAGLWAAQIGLICAAEPLPARRQTLELASAVSAPLAGPQMAPARTPAAPHLTPAVDCVNSCPPGYEATWDSLRPVYDFERWAQGEYVGRARLPHVPVYRLRVDDQLDFVFRVDRDRIPGNYKFVVGDSLLVESPTDPTLRRTLVVQPDGRITLPHVGQVEAAGRTITELRNDLDEKFKAYLNVPAITVEPLRINSKLEELRSTIAGQIGFAKQVFPGRVTPEGTVQLPAVGSVPAQGLTIEEFHMELNERFAEEIEGIEVVPTLQQHGPRYVYVLGEVAKPGRYTLEAPTTVMQAISMAGSWTVGAHITHVVVFRRADDWRLMATQLDMRAALLGRTPCPDGEIWVGDADLVIVPKSRLLRADNFIELVFTRGIYGVLPVGYAFNYSLFKNAIPPFLFVP
jgi:polysaccharide export outer membrane protein